jgi:hypothetical protein
VTHYCLQPGSGTHRISLFTLIRDVETLWEMCLTVGRMKEIPQESLGKVERLVRQRLFIDAALGIVSMVGRGHPRYQALAEAYGLRKYLRYRLAIGVLAVLAAAFLPRRMINTLRQFRRKRAGVPIDDAAPGSTRAIDA